MTSLSGGGDRRPRSRGRARRTGLGVAVAAVVTGVGVWAASAGTPEDTGGPAAAQDPGLVAPVVQEHQPDAPPTSAPTGKKDAAPPTSAPTGKNDAALATSAPAGNDDPAAPVVADAPVGDEEVASIIETAFEVTAGEGLLSAPELERAVDVDLAAVATGPMRAELEAELLEMQAQGWTREGSPTFSEIKTVADQSEDGTRLVVSACVDWSGVTYMEQDGSPVPPNPTPRARSIFTLVPDDEGGWVVHDREFPNNPHC